MRVSLWRVPSGAQLAATEVRLNAVCKSDAELDACVAKAAMEKNALPSLLSTTLTVSNPFISHIEMVQKTMRRDQHRAHSSDRLRDVSACFDRRTANVSVQLGGTRT